MKTRIIQHEPEPDGRGDPAGSAGPAAPQSVRGLVGRHRLTTFVLLAYLVGWCLLPVGTFLPCGPLLAAVVVTALADGRPGLRRLGARLVRWRVSPVWYLLALAVPWAVHAAAAGANLAAGAAAPSMAQFTPWYAVGLVLAAMLVDPVGGPLGEEPGWRGFAQPALQAARSPLRSTAILALLVTGWHLPLVLIPQFDLGPLDLATTIAVTFWYGWLFNRTGGSVLLTLLAHAAEGSVDFGSLWPAGPDADREHVTYLAAWVLLAGLLLLDRPAWRAAPPSAVDPAG